jgi:hypothetical protein
MLHMQLGALALMAVTIAASGCGGSSKKQPTTTTTATVAHAATTTASTPPTSTVKVATGKPLARTVFIARGDAICARTNSKLAANSANSRTEFIRLLSQVAVYDSSEAGALAKLVPPASLTSAWSKIISYAHLYSEYVNRAAAEGQTAGHIDGALVRAAEGEHKKLMSTALAVGFKQCSKTS